MKTAVRAPSGDGDAEEVVFSCSATGKPAPTIQWEFSPVAAALGRPQTATATNGDHTFTSSSNITLRVPAGWDGHVDCLLNKGARGQRRERIPFTSHAGNKMKGEEGMQINHFVWHVW